ncbi:MAG: winged-helix domain-containing protein [Candidatus Hodarchaeota archaeon]
MAYLVSTTNSRERIRVSRSAQAVLDLLSNKRTPLAVREIKEELPYSERTIHYALRQLRENSLVEKKANLRDLRESCYLLATKAALYGYIM